MRIRATLFASFILAATAPVANAAEIKVLTTWAVSTVLAEIGPQFERATGHKINISMDVAVALVRRVKAGEAFDLLVAPRPVRSMVRSRTAS
jgi:molybdate transport system substrate-binding protein